MNYCVDSKWMDVCIELKREHRKGMRIDHSVLYAPKKAYSIGGPIEIFIFNHQNSKKESNSQANNINLTCHPHFPLIYDLSHDEP